METEKLRELQKKIEQAEARLQKKKQALAAKIRKAEDAKKFKMGGLVVKAGLDNLDETTLLGVLLMGKEALTNTPQVAASFREKGASFFTQDKKAKDAAKRLITVSFPAPPQDEIRQGIKAAGLDWIEAESLWRGYGDPAILKPLADQGGGSFKVVEG